MAVLLGTVSWIYWPVLGNGLVWDDHAIWGTQLYRDPGRFWDAIGGPLIFGLEYFRPLAVLSFLAQFRAGLDAPSHLHAVNLGVHLFNVVLVLALSRRLFPLALEGGSYHYQPMLAALLYGIHPVLVEPVAWVSGRFDLLVTGFSLLALLSVSSHWHFRVAACALFFLAALLCKESAVMLIVVIPLLFEAGGHSRTATERKALWAALFLALAAYLSLRWLSLGGLAPLRLSGAASLPDHFAVAGHTLLGYAKLAIWPFSDMSPMYIRSREFSWDGLVLTLVVIGGGCLAWRGKVWRSRLAAPLLAAVICLVPVSGLITLPTGEAYMAGRFLTLPLALAALALPQLLSGWENGNLRLLRYGHILAGGFLLIWVAASLGTIRLTLPLWHDDGTFWRWMAERNPASGVVLENLSRNFLKERNCEEAATTAEKAMVLSGNKAGVALNYGEALACLGRHEEALEVLSEAYRQAPFRHELAAAMARVLVKVGDMPRALAITNEALGRLNGGNPGLKDEVALMNEGRVRYFFATILAAGKQYRQALDELRAARQLAEHSAAMSFVDVEIGRVSRHLDPEPGG